MEKFPKKLLNKLEQRRAENAFRQLSAPNNLIDFSSNDYLGFANATFIFNKTHDLLIAHNLIKNGATGSRLLSGNHKLYNSIETLLCKFHASEAALVFNSGYTANIGVFSTLPQRGDIIIYDEFIHASIRDGISMSHAKAYKFKHNSIDDLQEMLKRVQHDNDNQHIYVVTESVFSMDGDSPDLKLLTQFCNDNSIYLIVDEAHAVGVFGANGEGLLQQLALQDAVFARIITFGKALGSHGAAILGSEQLKAFLINFSRPLIYTTGLSPHTLATINTAYDLIQNTNNTPQIEKLHANIDHFNNTINRLKLTAHFIQSNSAIHCCIIPGNERVKNVAYELKEQGFDVKAILSPTVTKGQERLRFCLHIYNSKSEITKVLELLATFVHNERNI